MERSIILFRSQVVPRRQRCWLCALTLVASWAYQAQAGSGVVVPGALLTETVTSLLDAEASLGAAAAGPALGLNASVVGEGAVGAIAESALLPRALQMKIVMESSGEEELAGVGNGPGQQEQEEEVGPGSEMEIGAADEHEPNSSGARVVMEESNAVEELDVHEMELDVGDVNMPARTELGPLLETTSGGSTFTDDVSEQGFRAQEEGLSLWHSSNFAWEGTEDADNAATAPAATMTSADLRELLAMTRTETSATDTSTSRTSSFTEAVTSTGSSTATSSMTSSATSSATTSATSTATSSATSTATASATSTATASATSTATLSSTSTATSTATPTASSTVTSTATSTESSSTTSTSLTTSTRPADPVEGAVASPPDFTVNMRVLATVSDGTDPEEVCASLPATLSSPNFLGAPESDIRCLEWASSTQAGRLLTGRRPGSDGRELSASSSTGSFVVEATAQSELEAAVFSFRAATLNLTELAVALQEAGFEVEVLAVQNIVTERDSQPWTTRGSMELTIRNQDYTDDQVGNFLIDMFAQALANVSTAGGEFFAVDPSNITIFRRARNVSGDDAQTDAMSVGYFINSFRAEEDLAILAQLSAQDYAASLQRILDDMSVEMSIDDFDVVFDVFGKITVRSDAGSPEDQLKLTDPEAYNVEAMKTSVRDAAKAAYDLEDQEVGVSVLSITPYVEGDDSSNRIEVAYLYNPDTFERYCEIATEQETSAGQARLELALSYAGVDPTILPVIEAFYQDPTLSCAGSSAEEYDNPTKESTLYIVLFAVGLSLLAAGLLFMLYAWVVIRRRWRNSSLIIASGKADDEGDRDAALMEPGTMTERLGQDGVRAVRASALMISLPPADPALAAAEARDEMVVVMPDPVDDEPQRDRHSGKEVAADLDNVEELLDYEDDEPIV